MNINEHKINPLKSVETTHFVDEMHYVLDQLHILPINGNKQLILTRLKKVFNKKTTQMQIFFDDIIFQFLPSNELYNPQLTNRDSSLLNWLNM